MHILWLSRQCKLLDKGLKGPQAYGRQLEVLHYQLLGMGNPNKHCHSLFRSMKWLAPISPTPARVCLKSLMNPGDTSEPCNFIHSLGTVFFSCSFLRIKLDCQARRQRVWQLHVPTTPAGAAQVVCAIAQVKCNWQYVLMYAAGVITVQH